MGAEALFLRAEILQQLGRRAEAIPLPCAGRVPAPKVSSWPITGSAKGSWTMHTLAVPIRLEHRSTVTKPAITPIDITPQNMSSVGTMARMSWPIIRKVMTGAMPAIMKFMLMNSGKKLRRTFSR